MRFLHLFFKKELRLKIPRQKLKRDKEISLFLYRNQKRYHPNISTKAITTIQKF